MTDHLIRCEPVDFAVERSGRRQLGGWTVDWGAGASGGGRRTPAGVRLTVRGGTDEATVHVVTREIAPFASTLRRGVELDCSWGEVVAVARNGPRPIAALRRITVRSAERRWTASGGLVGTSLVDDADGSVLARTVAGLPRVDLDRPAGDLAVVLTLLGLTIPQSLALTGFRASL